MSTSETFDQAPAPDTKRLRLHRSLRQQVGAALADELMEFLPPAGWGELARRSDVEFVHQRLDQKIDHLRRRRHHGRFPAVGCRVTATGASMIAAQAAL